MCAIMTDQRFCIDIGGVLYMTTVHTLQKSNTIRRILAKHNPALDDTPPFVDRDGGAFYYVLNFLRNGTVHFIADSSYVQFLINEAGYYGLAAMELQLSNMLSDPKMPP